MKKSVITFLLFLMIILNPIQIFADNEATDNLVFIILNDSLVSFQDNYPIVINGTTYVPIRFFSDNIGADVEYNSDKLSISIVKDKKEVSIDVPNRTLFTKEGQILTDGILIKDSSIMVPLKFTSKFLGYKVDFIKKGPIVRVENIVSSLANERMYKAFKDKIQDEKNRIALEIRIKEEVEKERKRQQLQKIADSDKNVYITFDDGPSRQTEEILNILDEYNAKATFFMLSNNIANYPNVVKKMVDKGHAVGLHGVTHDVKKIYKSSASLLWEMNTCNSSLQKVVGFRSDIVRAPYGSKPYMSQELKNAVIRDGFKIWDWNIDSKDSQRGGTTAKKIIENVKSQLERQTTPVILFHEKEITVKALPQVLQYLQSKNYKLVPINNNATPVNFWR